MKSNTTFTETLFTGAGRILLMSVIFLGACDSQVEPAPDQVHSKADPVEAYIDRWVAFYPSAAFGQGMKSAALRFEDFSEPRVADWVAFNRTTEKILASVPETAALQERIDARVLLRQLKFELDLWDEDKVLSHQPQWYVEQVSDALALVMVSEKLDATEKYMAVVNRMAGIRALVDVAISNLRDGNPARIETALKTLVQTTGYYENELPALAEEWTEEADRDAFKSQAISTANKLHELEQHIRDKILPHASVPSKFGPDVYARKLAIYSDNSLTPDGLSALALEEIDLVRGLMLEVASAWWSETHAGQAVPEEQALLDAALAAMEEDRSDNRKDFLKVFSDATNKAIEFVRQHDLATLPANHKIIVDMYPTHHSHATIGGVYPPGPFDPDAETLLYLPSIADDAPEEAKDGFYRSFNDHFNLMIVPHELFPGHDMQFKVGLEYAPKIRALFHNQYYSEGWASLSEIIMLNAGWADGNKLTLLAHYRKRLENATRAYISVMVHAQGWDKEQVIEFAATRGQLPPQFAENLWYRSSGLYNALQLTSYFVGAHGIKQIWQEQQQRLGADFVQKDFIDTLLRAGSVSIASLREIFALAPTGSTRG